MESLVTDGVRCWVAAPRRNKIHRWGWAEQEAKSPGRRGVIASLASLVATRYESLQLMLFDLQHEEFRDLADPHFPAEYPGLPNRHCRMICLPAIVFVLVCELPF